MLALCWTGNCTLNQEKPGGVPMRYVKTILKFVFAVFFIVGGINHFRAEDFYMKLMPDYIPANLHLPAVHLSGVAEVLLGVMLLFRRTQRAGGLGFDRAIDRRVSGQHLRLSAFARSVSGSRSRDALLAIAAAGRDDRLGLVVYAAGRAGGRCRAIG